MHWRACEVFSDQHAFRDVLIDCTCGTFCRTLSNKLIEYKTYKDICPEQITSWSFADIKGIKDEFSDLKDRIFCLRDQSEVILN